MAILSGFFRSKKRRKTNDGYKLESQWTSSQTVVMGDGTDDTDTVESRFGDIKGITTSTTESETGKVLDASTYATNVGAIQGITSSLATDNENYALSASAGKDLQDQITDVNSNLGKTISNVASIVGYTEGIRRTSAHSVTFNNTNFVLVDVSAYIPSGYKIADYCMVLGCINTYNESNASINWIAKNSDSQFTVKITETINASLNIALQYTLVPA